MDNVHQSETDKDQYKFSKNADEAEFFGMRTNTTDVRHDYARVASQKVEIIMIDKEYYDQIVKKT